MKKHFKMSGIFLFVAYLVFCSLAVAQPPLAIDLKLDSTAYFQETKVPAEASSAIRAVAEPGDTLYRFFQAKDDHHWAIVAVFDRFNQSWLQYPKDESSSVSVIKKGFTEFLNENDPRLLAKIRQLAPRLSFDFLGKNGTKYVLREIEIETIRFEEYSGGGFSDEEEWYDIELSHHVGIKRYSIEGKKLEFSDGSGRCILRFWSDNYYKNLGMAPMGCYDIDITFHFWADGHRISVSTGRFKIDV
jgi:hypothetical protein